MPVALLTLFAIRCIEWGGPVLIMASTGWDLRYFIRKRADGLIQRKRGSGMKRFPLMNMESLCIRDLGFSAIMLAFMAPPLFFPVKRL